VKDVSNAGSAIEEVEVLFSLDFPQIQQAPANAADADGVGLRGCQPRKLWRLTQDADI